MFSRGRPGVPRNNSISSRLSLHPPHEVACVLNIINEILTVSAEIIRREEKGNSCLHTPTLDTVSGFSESLWEEIKSLPLSTISPLREPLIIYKLILVDIQRITSSTHPVEISDDTIDRRLDDFLFQFQEALDLLKCTGQRKSPNSIHFFQNSDNTIITGGNFSVSISNLVVPDPAVPLVREQSHKILQSSENCSCGGEVVTHGLHDYFSVHLQGFCFHMEVGCVPA